MRDEYEALIRNKTWSLVSSSAEHKVVGNKWVFRVKQNSDGSIVKYKARLVAKGFQQTEGVDYFETFSPVVKSSTVRIILSLAAMHKWTIRQVDVNNAFLNGELTEDVYMCQLEGFVDLQKPNYVCKLKKALYGLKQAPRACKVFALKDLGKLSCFPGIEVSDVAEDIYLSQRKYIRDLLSKADMLECKGCNTSMVTGVKLQKEAKVNKLSQYVSAPTLQHVIACKRVLRYLKETENYGLKFSTEGEMKLSSYTDADWSFDIDDRKSTAKLALPTHLRIMLGVALKMQREVEKLVHHFLKKVQNIDGKTAQDIFIEQHKDFLENSEKWMKYTSNSCMVVTALIATMMFATACTVPGGNIESGNPIFLRDKLFMVFAISYALGFIFTSTPLLVFVSIQIAQYAEKDCWDYMLF
ncbi:reverse transcriptase Ty1/copia-type domain-containing protein [Citrus sinensis]|uniref:Reverse transcriptase Ty1/copia-type domain-containing protein n=1 Tax=Citrus sinensis TaxID=2711 RepID=A0ACB8K8P1_CITSI|nr:reverse transcriptase Ty1/copia-type domain-containing protein [Citrus sinensis]